MATREEIKLSNAFAFTRALAKIIRENLDKSPIEIASLQISYLHSQGEETEELRDVLVEHGQYRDVSYIKKDGTSEVKRCLIVPAVVIESTIPLEG